MVGMWLKFNDSSYRIIAKLPAEKGYRILMTGGRDTKKWVDTFIEHDDMRCPTCNLLWRAQHRVD